MGEVWGTHSLAKSLGYQPVDTFAKRLGRIGFGLSGCQRCGVTTLGVALICNRPVVRTILFCLISASSLPHLSFAELLAT